MVPVSHTCYEHAVAEAVEGGQAGEGIAAAADAAFDEAFMEAREPSRLDFIRGLVPYMPSRPR